MLERLLILSAVLFCIGLYGALSRRHVIAVLICVEIMFNAVNIALVALSRYITPAALRATGEVNEAAVRSLLARLVAAEEALRLAPCVQAVYSLLGEGEGGLVVGAAGQKFFF